MNECVGSLWIGLSEDGCVLSVSVSLCIGCLGLCLVLLVYMQGVSGCLCCVCVYVSVGCG